MRLSIYCGKKHKEEEYPGGGRRNSDKTRVTNTPVCLGLNGFLDVGFSVVKSEKSWALLLHWRHCIFHFNYFLLI